jgi:hypothetical protein
MKRTMITGSAAITFMMASSFSLLSPDGKAGYTGSPGEETCHSCHNSFARNSGPGSISLHSNIPEAGFTPGETYTMQVVVAQGTRSLFGFDTEALKADGSNSGTIIVTNSAKTQLRNVTVQGKSRRNITHQSNGGASSDSAVFEFNWTAPATGDATTFYFAGIAANKNGLESGDYVYNSSRAFTVAPVSTGITAHAIRSWKVYPNPVSGTEISYSFQLDEKTMEYQLQLFSLDGKLIYEKDMIAQDSQVQDKLIVDDIPAGTYLLVCRAAQQSVQSKIFIL